MKGKRQLLLISAVLILGMCFAVSSTSWGADASPPASATLPDGQTVVAQADAATPGAQPTPATKAATPADTTNVPTTEVTVKAEKESKPKEGSTELGYKVENTTTTGPWGQMKLQDAPYSIMVMPSEMIENVQASTPDDLYRINPLVQLWTPTGRAPNPGVILRGFSQNNGNGRAEDGIHAQLESQSLEDKERVEVITGLSSFLYGPGNVGGMVNFVSKRPTWTPLYSITGGNYGGSEYYAHGDIGGPIYKDKVAYRLNVLTEDGDTDVHYQSIKRNLVSGALDWRVTDSLLLQFNGSHEENRVDGAAPFWFFTSNALGAATAFHPSAPDAEKNWGQKFAEYSISTDKATERLTWDLNDVFTLRAAYRYSVDDFKDAAIFANNFVTANDGSYRQILFKRPEYHATSNGGYALLDAKFKIGSIENKVTAGYYGDRLAEQFGNGSYASAFVNNLNFSAPTYISQPAFTGDGGSLTRDDAVESRNVLIGDELKFTDAWSALIGVNYTEIIEKNYDSITGALTSQYDQGKATPTASLLYKPVPWVTTYATYMQSLEQGTIVPATGPINYTNGGQALAPFTSYQYEVGAKATLGGMLLTMALFDIDRALQYDVDNGNGTFTSVQDGREVHKGIEFTATGKATKDLTLWGGVTLLDAQIKKNASNPQWEGKVPTDVAEQMIKLYAEYSVPWVPGFTITGGIYYTGKKYADQMNTDSLPAVTTADIGARYTTKVYAYPLILRLNVTNVTNKSYWLDSYYTGDPRRIMFSAQMKF